MQYFLPIIKDMLISFTKLGFWKEIFFENLGYLKIIQLMSKLLRYYDITITIKICVITIQCLFLLIIIYIYITWLIKIHYEGEI
jgi:hypothetical protein